MLILVAPMAQPLASWRAVLALGWVPWMLCGTEVLARRGGKAWAPWLGAALALVLGSLLVAAAPARHMLPVDALAALVLPRRGPGPYFTMLALGAAALAVVLAPRPRAWPLLGAAVLGVIGTLAWDHALLGVTQLALAGLCGEGLHALATFDDERKRTLIARAILVVGALAAMAFALAFVTAVAPLPGKPAPPRETVSLALAGALVATWVLHRVVRAETRARLWFAGVAATALFLELWMAHAPALEPTWKR